MKKIVSVQTAVANKCTVAAAGEAAAWENQPRRPDDGEPTGPNPAAAPQVQLVSSEPQLSSSSQVYDGESR